MEGFPVALQTTFGKIDFEVPGMIRKQEDPRRNGTCGLCGGHGRELRVLAVNDFIGWACEECRRQLRICQVRRFTPAGEETEPGE